jgi:hypothetical protein
VFAIPQQIQRLAAASRLVRDAPVVWPIPQQLHTLPPPSELPARYLRLPIHFRYAFVHLGSSTGIDAPPTQWYHAEVTEGAPTAPCALGHNRCKLKTVDTLS